MQEKIKLYVATPVHSNVSIHYLQTVIMLQKKCYELGIEFTLQTMKCSLVTNGRNICVSDFMNSDCTHMLFLDSDIQIEADSIVTMINKNKQLLCIPYPLKTVKFDKMYAMQKLKPDLNLEQMSMAGNVYPIRLADDQSIEFKDGICEITHSAAGCLLIQKKVFTKMIDKYPDLKIKQEIIVDNEKVFKPNLYNFFDTYFDKNNNLYYGEDFAFSRLWRNIGGKCYALITEYITHVGDYSYTGRLIDEMYPVGIDTKAKNK
tara:strand:- start:204 stop:986 length:783 start_codon:yes stop_codon:yes gene_type:complete